MFFPVLVAALAKAWLWGFAENRLFTDKPLDTKVWVLHHFKQYHIWMAVFFGTLNLGFAHSHSASYVTVATEWHSHAVYFRSNADGGHGHSVTGSTASGGVHGHTLSNKPTYVRGVTLFKQDGTGFGLGAVFQSMPDASITELWTLNTTDVVGATEVPKSVTFDWVAVAV